MLVLFKIKKLLSILLFGTLVFFFNSNTFAEVKYVETNAKGSGESFEIALKKAFTRAISKVNGVSVESESVLKPLIKVLQLMKDLQLL